MGCRRDDEGGLLQGAGKEGNDRGKAVAGKQSRKKSREGNSGKGIPWVSPKKVYAIQITLPEVSVSASFVRGSSIFPSQIPYYEFNFPKTTHVNHLKPRNRFEAITNVNNSFGFGCAVFGPELEMESSKPLSLSS